MLLGLSSGFGFRERVEMLASEFRVIEIERTRVRLLFGDADLGEEVDQDFRLDLQLAREFVNSNLIRVRHSLRLFFLLAVLRVFFFVAVRRFRTGAFRTFD